MVNTFWESGGMENPRKITFVKGNIIHPEHRSDLNIFFFATSEGSDGYKGFWKKGKPRRMIGV